MGYLLCFLAGASFMTGILVSYFVGGGWALLGVLITIITATIVIGEAQE